jgi:SAM-dependent methyltransferase
MVTSKRIAQLAGRVGALLALGAAAVAVARHARGDIAGRRVAGGILIRDAAGYDAMSRLFLAPFFRRIAADVARVAPQGARVLDIGCGPGLLSTQLALDHGLDVTGLDLDPAMIERARIRAQQGSRGGRPTFVVGDASSLTFPDAAFDLVVSTLSMHHWSDPAAGLVEIGRVLRPDGRALIWELRPGAVPFHSRVPDPTEHVGGSGLRVERISPWRWPLRFSFTRRIELVPLGRRDREPSNVA